MSDETYRVNDDEPRHRVTPVSVAGLQAEIERLRAIVDELPKTADGVPVTPGMRVIKAVNYGSACRLDWPPTNAGWNYWVCTFHYHSVRADASEIGSLYSCIEAAKAAEEDGT